MAIYKFKSKRKECFDIKKMKLLRDSTSQISGYFCATSFKNKSEWIKLRYFESGGTFDCVKGKLLFFQEGRKIDINFLNKDHIKISDMLLKRRRGNALWNCQLD